MEEITKQLQKLLNSLDMSSAKILKLTPNLSKQLILSEEILIDGIKVCINKIETYQSLTRYKVIYSIKHNGMCFEVASCSSSLTYECGKSPVTWEGLNELSVYIESLNLKDSVNMEKIYKLTKTTNPEELFNEVKRIKNFMDSLKQTMIGDKRVYYR